MYAGFRELELVDTARNLRMPAWLLYPTEAEPRVERLGPYELDIAIGAPAAGGELPLVAYSHGNGATPWVARGLLLALVRAGFVVVTLEHPGNNRRDNSLANGPVPKLANLEYRPRHLQLAIDAALADPDLGPHMRASAIAVMGHSLGGYAALALAGGRAMTFPDDIDVARRVAPDPKTLRLAFSVATPHDSRIRAAVLLSPGLGFFGAPGALAGVTARLLVRSGALDPICPPAQTAHALRELPTPQLELAVVPDAGHFSFLSPFPPELAHLPPAQDPPGFDRAAYQHVLAADVTAFLREVLV